MSSDTDGFSSEEKLHITSGEKELVHDTCRTKDMASSWPNEGGGFWPNWLIKKTVHSLCVKFLQENCTHYPLSSLIPTRAQNVTCSTQENGKG